ncbi:MAG TPA: trehalose-phosphatase [Povalibacter sp.]|uniref:trehalose-phosphatase n=1 Tax=Povalibacter sp. TaxID=1962978 RepID=UPI002BF13C10|nr:trehalose-phosphatase [Povalibacter sp.]HMN44056.1 trehalose-phosphatase [Povalibacter sp.]
MTVAAIPPPTHDLALFLDVDGTLIEIASTPHAVVVPESLKALLQALSKRLDGALALVSGRSLPTLDSLFAPLQFAAAGIHGCERRAADGRLVLPTIDEQRFAAARDELAQWSQRHPGSLLEDKRYALALHYRLAPQLESAAFDEAQRALRQLGGTHELQRGKFVFELRPAGYSKGTAVAAFMREAPFRGRRPLFIGDDVTDEDGFGVVNDLGGISIRVGDVAETAARHRLADVGAVHRWLGELQ